MLDEKKLENYDNSMWYIYYVEWTVYTTKLT